MKKTAVSSPRQEKIITRGKIEKAQVHSPKPEKPHTHGVKPEKSSGHVSKHDRQHNIKTDKHQVNGSAIDGHRAESSKRKKEGGKQLSLTPPEYYIDPQKLLGDFVEEDVAFAGRIDNFPVHEDVTNRTTVLQTIDRGKKHGIVSWGMTTDNKATLSINVFNIKILRAKNEELLLRVSTHHIAAISYIKDDRQHILALKYGDPKKGCQLAVIYCENKHIAEEICALVGQCFQLVYTDATMEYIDRQFDTALHGAGGSRTRTDSNSSVFEPTIFGSRPTRGVPQRLAFVSASSNGSAYSSSVYRSLPGRRGAPSAASDSSSWSAAELLQDYLNKLHKKLTSQELKTFAQLLTTRHTDLTFTQFCDKVLDLFGQNRKHLMTGLWPFIGDRDHASFEKYLERKGIAPFDDSGYWSMPGSASGSSRVTGEEGPVIVRYMDSIHYEESSPSKRSLTSHSDPGPGGHSPTLIRFMDNIHYSDPYVTIP